VHAAGRHLKGLLHVATTESGLHTVGYLARTLRETEISQDAAARDIRASPIGRFAISPVALNGLVLGFGSVPPKSLEAGVKVLAEVIAARVKPKPAARR
jgi:GntR family transcriptional regulator/MocR family aminotransferase